MLCRSPRIAVVAGVDLDSVLVGVLIIQRYPHPVVGSPQRQNSQILQPDIGSQQVVNRGATESHVLKSSVTASVGVYRGFGDFKKYDTVV